MNKRIDILVGLGDYLRLRDERLHAHLKRTAFNNKWFTIPNLEFALDTLSHEWLDKEKLEAYSIDEKLPEEPKREKIGIINQEKIPLAAFGDMARTFMEGNVSIVKLQEDSLYLLPFLVRKMDEISPGAAEFFQFPDTLPLKECAGIIATLEADRLYFYEKYFGHRKKAFRLLKKSAAVIFGNETEEDFHQLAKDVLTYFGRSAKNVSKLYVPRGYDFNVFLQIFHNYKDIIRMDAYKNNYDYQISLLILNKTLHWNNGSIILARKEALHSPISVLHYEEYDDENDLLERLNAKADDLQQVISKKRLGNFKTLPFGSSLSS